MSEGGLGTGAIAGLVLAVIFFILVITVLVAILVVYFRHKTFTKSYEFDVSEETGHSLVVVKLILMDVAFWFFVQLSLREREREREREYL